MCRKENMSWTWKESSHLKPRKTSNSFHINFFFHLIIVYLEIPHFNLFPLFFFFFFPLFLSHHFPSSLSKSWLHIFLMFSTIKREQTIKFFGIVNIASNVMWSLIILWPGVSCLFITLWNHRHVNSFVDLIIISL